jgi:hypothetical protein
MKKSSIILLFILSHLIVHSQCNDSLSQPIFVNFQPEITVSCESYADMTVEAYDECSSNLEFAWVQDTIPGHCPGSVDYIRIWRVFDSYGNSVVEPQIIHVVDETAPTFTFIPASYTIDCVDTVGFGTPIVTDNCNQFNLTFEDFYESEGNCNRQLIRVWTAVDECGNSSSASQYLEFIDNTPPAITGEIYIEVPFDTNIDTAFVQVQENCGTFNLTYSDVETSGNSIIRTYSAIDECGNISTYEQIIHFVNNNRVQICHRLGNGNWITLNVAPAAVPAHLNHGDYLGSCQPNNFENQQIPMRMGIEILENGKIVKTVKRNN